MRDFASLPLAATEIYVEWRKGEYGIGVTARTDDAGLPYIGLYPLNWEGQPIGMPVYFQRRRLMADIVAGPVWSKPTIIFIDAEATTRGLSLRVCLPSSLAAQGDCTRHLSARWGSPSPKFHAFPANSNWPVNPTPREIDA